MPTRTALAAAGALIVIACGCSSGNGKANVTTPSSSVPRTTSSRPAPPTSSSTTIPGAGLAPLMLDMPPSEFARKPDELADTGPTGFEKAVRDDPSPDETDARTALLAAGFLRGYQRQWSTADAVGQNFLYLYQFATPDGAVGFLQHWRAVTVVGVGRAQPVPFEPALPGAMGLQANDAQGSVGVVLFSKGPYAVQAVVTGPPGVNQSSPAVELAFAQFARLP